MGCDEDDDEVASVLRVVWGSEKPLDSEISVRFEGFDYEILYLGLEHVILRGMDINEPWAGPSGGWGIVLPGILKLMVV